MSKCGIDCGTCPWGPYPRKNMTSEDFEQFRTNAKRILGYMPIKTPCFTCQTPDTQIPKQSKLPNRKCLIRKCVEQTGITNCAYCSQFPCDTLEATAGAWNRAKIEEKLGSKISKEEYSSFVKPFEAINRLKNIRKTLKPNEIKKPAKNEVTGSQIVEFPKELLLSEKEIDCFKRIHKLISTFERSPVGLKNIDSLAQQHQLEKIRAHLQRFLWIMGTFGRFEKNRTGLFVEAQIYLSNRGKEKTLAIWSFVEETVFKLLSEQGVQCERIARPGFIDAELTTGTGYLRNKGWIMRMSFEEEAGGGSALEALRTYSQRLNEKYGQKAFRKFRSADMNVLSN